MTLRRLERCYPRCFRTRLNAQQRPYRKDPADIAIITAAYLTQKWSVLSIEALATKRLMQPMIGEGSDSRARVKAPC